MLTTAGAVFFTTSAKESCSCSFEVGTTRVDWSGAACAACAASAAMTAAADSDGVRMRMSLRTLFERWFGGRSLPLPSGPVSAKKWGVGKAAEGRKIVIGLTKI